MPVCLFVHRRGYRVILLNEMILRVKIFITCLLLLPCACSSVKLLDKQYYATDFIIHKDGTLMIEDDKVAMDELERQLILKMINNNAHIYIHVHEKAPPSALEELYARLRRRGYKNLTFKTFNSIR